MTRVCSRTQNDEKCTHGRTLQDGPRPACGYLLSINRHSMHRAQRAGRDRQRAEATQSTARQRKKCKWHFHLISLCPPKRRNLGTLCCPKIASISHAAPAHLWESSPARCVSEPAVCMRANLDTGVRSTRNLDFAKAARGKERAICILVLGSSGQDFCVQ